MVLAAENSTVVSHVVFVVEGTANLSPYVESLKMNYILPTLEYFNGGPSSEADTTNDYNHTLYGLVVFMSADYAMEPITTCYAPTTSTFKLLSWFEKVMFIGGCAEAYSHIAEGLSTALQVFDDFQALRDPSTSVQKHCILVCNSSSYLVPALESPAYSGFTTDQLATIIAERQINFTVLSPRKIPMLYRLFEKAGGDLQHALSKNYAKDKRHLVLLRGYQLQERPMSPSLVDNKTIPPDGSVRSTSPPGGQKRPPSPSNARDNIAFKKPPPTGQAQNVSLPGANLPSTQSPVSVIGYGQSSQAPTLLQSRANPTAHLSVLNQPNPPNVTITNKTAQQLLPEGIHKPRDQSPIPAGLNWTQPSSPTSAATNSVLATQLSITSQNAQLCPQADQRAPLRVPSTTIGGMAMNPSGAVQYSFPQQQSPSMVPQQGLQALNPQAKINSPGLNQNSPGGMIKNETRCKIWQGVVEYMERITSPLNKITFQLPCTITCNVVNGEPEVSAEQWPKTLQLQLFPRALLTNPPLCNHLKNNARHISIFFNKDSEGLQNLQKLMPGCVGCFQLTPHCDIKIIIVIYMPDKRSFMGMIAHDQEGFLNLLRQQNEAYRKQQQAAAAAAASGKVRMANSPNMMHSNLTPPQQQPPQQLAVPNPQAQQAPQQPQSTRYASTLSIEAERQQNLLKIQQLQQNLEAAQQKELQYKAAQEQTPFRQMPQMQNLPNQQMSGPNPQLRHLLQQQVQQQIRPQPHQQILMTSGGMRPQLASNPSLSQAQSCWDEAGLMDLLPPNV